MVVWTALAERDLAAAWPATTERTALTRAAHDLDGTLGRQPFALGEGRESSVSRIVFDPPLALRFGIVEDDKKVFVGAGLTR